jgi:hypothetical protein
LGQPEAGDRRKLWIQAVASGTSCHQSPTAKHEPRTIGQQLFARNIRDFGLLDCRKLEDASNAIEQIIQSASDERKLGIGFCEAFAVYIDFLRRIVLDDFNNADVVVLASR